VTDAAVHDSQTLAALLDKANTSADVFADSAPPHKNERYLLSVVTGTAQRSR
jgi:hypothetical protein